MPTPEDNSEELKMILDLGLLTARGRQKKNCSSYRINKLISCTSAHYVYYYKVPE